jgi:tight adherence protein C
MLEEFPTVAELLAMAVTAAEGRWGRSSASTDGDLSREPGRAPVRGAPRRVAAPGARRHRPPDVAHPLARCVDGIAIAVERVTVSKVGWRAVT